MYPVKLYLLLAVVVALARWWVIANYYYAREIATIVYFKFTQIARGFVENGAKVYISARSKKECDETARELTALGPGICTAIPANLQELGEVDRLIKELERYETTLHVLVNNAGAAWGAMIDDYPDVRLLPCCCCIRTNARVA
jgi:NADP-dependent 3-hydroxy acid dehydrogenase YdfG